MVSLNFKYVVLVPTQMELDLIRSRMKNCHPHQFELVGFGPIAAAARASQIIARFPGCCYVLAGIAGSYADGLVGTALQFETVASFGIGAGSGEQHLSGESIGYSQLEGIEFGRVGDAIGLKTFEGISTAKQLLTVCSSSAGRADAKLKKTNHPDAVAEDMEGFGVALACAISQQRLSIVRGISNVAGDRDIRAWKIEEAIAAVCKVLDQLFDASGTERSEKA